MFDNLFVKLSYLSHQTAPKIKVGWWHQLQIPSVSDLISRRVTFFHVLIVLDGLRVSDEESLKKINYGVFGVPTFLAVSSSAALFRFSAWPLHRRCRLPLLILDSQSDNETPGFAAGACTPIGTVGPTELIDVLLDFFHRKLWDSQKARRTLTDKAVRGVINTSKIRFFFGQRSGGVAFWQARVEVVTSNLEAGDNVIFIRNFLSFISFKSMDNNLRRSFSIPIQATKRRMSCDLFIDGSDNRFLISCSLTSIRAIPTRRSSASSHFLWTASVSCCWSSAQLANRSSRYDGSCSFYFNRILYAGWIVLVATISSPFQLFVVGESPSVLPLFWGHKKKLGARRPL